MCAELTGAHFQIAYYLTLCYLSIPLGWDGAPGNFALFEDAISAIHSMRGMDRPGRFFDSPSLSKFYVDDGMSLDHMIKMRQEDNTADLDSTTMGLLGQNALNFDKLAEEGLRGKLIPGSGLTSTRSPSLSG